MQNLEAVGQKWLIYEYFGLVFTFYKVYQSVLGCTKVYQSVPKFTRVYLLILCYVLLLAIDFSQNYKLLSSSELPLYIDLNFG